MNDLALAAVTLFALAAFVLAVAANCALSTVHCALHLASPVAGITSTP